MRDGSMLFQQIINIFSSNIVLSFLSEYIATKAMDHVWKLMSLKKTVQYQLIEALENALENFCEIMNWEYDSSAITDTFIYSVDSLGGIGSKLTLKSVIENAVGTNIDDQQLDTWVACFNLSITNSERTELLNYLITNNIFNISAIVTQLQTDVVDIRNLVIKEAMKIIQKIDELRDNRNIASEIFVSIAPFQQKHQISFKNIEKEFCLEYIYKRNNISLHISPSMEYLAKLNSGKLITQISYLWEPFNWYLPSFDIKLVNNSDKTLYVTDILFKSINSTLDPSPVLIMPTPSGCANARHILIVNDGWGKMQNLRVRLSAGPINRCEEIDFSTVTLSHELFIGDVDRKVNIDISNILLDYGLISSLDDLYPAKNTLYKHRVTYENHKSDFTEVYGEFIYEGVDFNGRIKKYVNKFKAIVYLYEWNLEDAPAPPSYYYDVKFKTDKKGYSVYKSVSQVLKPKGYDRFVVTIGLEKSSYHEFDMQIITNLGTYTFPKISLLAFVPRSGVGFCHKSRPRNEIEMLY